MKAGKIKGVTPLGDMVLVELLTQEDILGPKAISLLDGEAPIKNQAWVVEKGAGVPEKCGFEVADRVVVVGRYVPVPNFRSSENRELGLVTYQEIKAVLKDSLLE